MDIRIVDGRLTKDAEIKENQTSGTKFLSFTLANNGFTKNGQVTTYFNVISYNEHDIKRLETLTKGRLVIVQGRPNEVMTIKDNKTYLNRNITAYNIEIGPSSTAKDAVNTTSYSNVTPPTPTVSNVAPTVPMCETPTPPTVHVTPMMSEVKTTPNPSINTGGYQAEVNISTSNDDLPF